MEKKFVKDPTELKLVLKLEWDLVLMELNMFLLYSNFNRTLSTLELFLLMCFLDP